ncbi:MAG: hypothetical protein O7H39_05380 [Gammaproteobacteria bacterium]|nr:hypothetical protein [Gammaproteobacteria bacterium]
MLDLNATAWLGCLIATFASVPMLGDAARVTAREPARVIARESEGVATALDFDVGVQARYFPQTGARGQARFHPSVSFQMQYHRVWNSGHDAFTARPFFRYDREDDERTHADLREFLFTHVGRDWDVQAGIGQVFWGVTEFRHLVDIINQTDRVENIDGEDKLGQPMIKTSLVRDWGILDIYVLPGFRDRTFPGVNGRLRTEPIIDADLATYDSGAKRRRIDGAIRWSHFIGPLEFGLHHFSGTSRDPELRLVDTGGGELVFSPHYAVIDQTGIDAQLIFGDWAWKLEALTRAGQGDRYAAVTFGVEHTLVGVFGSRSDLGIVAEYMYDDRGLEALTLFENDVALGARWRRNDFSDTQALLGWTFDVRTGEYIFSLELSRRVGDTWSLYLESRVFGGAGVGIPPDKSASLQRDDYIQLELTRFF